MEFLEVLTEGLERVLMVRGGGREVITIYSWAATPTQTIVAFTFLYKKCYDFALTMLCWVGKKNIVAGFLIVIS